MQIRIQGQKINVGDSLRAHVEDKIHDITSKYFNRAIDSDVMFTREGNAFIKVHISIRIGKDIMVMADDSETDAYAAFDVAAVRVAKQLRRYKKKLRDHHDRMEETPEGEILKARDYVLATQADELEPEQSEKEGDPTVVAEVTTNIPTLTVSEAVMRMDLSGQPAFMFRNASHDGLNMVYRRSDGNVGWVDPVIAEQVQAKKKIA